MRLIGLTGGIATGKSTFAAELQKLGVPVVDADALARAAVAKGSAGLAAVVEAFGEGALDGNGELDRKRMAARVFADPAARAWLEAIVHPAVRAGFRDEVERLRSEGHPLAFYDVPLLYEAGLQGLVELVVVVFATREVQLERLSARDGLSREEAEARLAAQLPIEEKASRADAVVMNDAGPEALARAAAQIVEALRGGLARRLPNAAPRRYGR